METINYTDLDPIVVPVIQYMREQLGINTEFSCQGRVRGEKKNPPHSLSGYISAKYSDSTFQTFFKIYELEKSRWPKSPKKGRGPVLEVFIGPEKRQEVVAVYLPMRLWETEKELKDEWNLILETIKQ